MIVKILWMCASSQNFIKWVFGRPLLELTAFLQAGAKCDFIPQATNCNRNKVNFSLGLIHICSKNHAAHYNIESAKADENHIKLIFSYFWLCSSGYMVLNVQCLVLFFPILLTHWVEGTNSTFLCLFNHLPNLGYKYLTVYKAIF